LLFGIERLAPGCRSFIKLLVHDPATMLPKDRVVIEILETIQMDQQVVECCRCLKQAGYALALDDFQDRPRLETDGRAGELHKSGFADDFA
jgi:EAL and modified HD-GYP domain-containing signal transduction protein